MSDETSATVERTVTIPPGTTDRLTRQFTLWLFTRPIVLIPLAFLAGVALAIAFGGIASGRASDVTLLVSVAIALAAGGLLTFLVVRRTVAKTWPEGTAATVRLSGDELRSTGLGTTALRLYRSVHVTRDGLILVMRGIFNAKVVPRALFTEAETHHIRTRVSELRKSGG